MNRKVNADDVARLAHVSRSAVSRSFTVGASVAPDTRARILAAAATLGYQPASKKREEGEGGARTVAVIMANLLSPYFAELSDRLNAELESRGLRALFFISSDPARLNAVMEHALSRHVDGMIMFSAQPSSRALAAARKSGVPIVILNRHERLEDASLVWIDGAEIGRSVARLMLDEGRRRPLAIATKPQRSRELEAFAETMAAGGAMACQWIDTGWFYEDGLRVADQLCTEEPLPDAIFAASDALAIGIWDGLRRNRSVRVPDELSIFGFGNTAQSDWLSHTISTVRLPIVSLIQTAVSTLMARMISVEEPAPRIWLSGDLVERATSLGSERPLDPEWDDNPA